MRAFPALALVVYLVSCLCVIGAWVPLGGRHTHGGLAIIQARATDPSSSTTVDATSTSDSATTSATNTNHTTATTNSTSASAATTAASTTVASLNTSAPSKNETDQTAAGELPLEPLITPALGVSGVILIASGAFLAFIGIRNLRVQVFLSTAFLTSLGVTVLIVYVMNPPVRTAIQGAYLVAVFFTGVTFGALSLVFKELSEGLGCLLGGFCCSMWLLCLKPGGLLTETDAKSGFIGAFSVAFYALSFSQYTRPYGLMASTGISGGTAVALGIDCYSRAGLKEFWLYLWALNDDIFPLGTDTYPVTRNIRVELAATVIIAILGVVSQLRLWRVIRERRHKDEEMRAEERRQKEEAEAENSKRLEEDNMKERMEWEAKYGNNPGPNLPELPGDAKCLADIEMEKADGIDSVSSSSGESYRCSDCRERADNGESAYASSVTSDTSGATEGSQTRQQDDDMPKSLDGEDSSQVPDDKNAARIKMFDGTVAAQMRDDESSDMTAIVGSDTDSDRVSEGSSWAKSSVKNSVRSDSQEALIPPKDNSPSSHEKTDARSGAASSSPTIAAEGEVATKEPLDAKEKSTDKEPSPSMVTSFSRGNAGENMDDRSVYSREVEDQKLHPMQAIDATQEENDGAPDEKGDECPASYSTPQAKDKTTVDEKQELRKEDPEQSELTGEMIEKTDPNNNKSQASVSEDTNSGPEYKGPKPPEAQEPRSSSGTESSSKKSEISTGKRKSSKPEPKTKAKPKKEEPVKLDAKAVKHLPHRASRMIQSYRTDEWAKHLADAEIPEPEPIHSVEDEQHEGPEETQETAAPVNVEELLQTPLNARPPPAIEHTLGRQPSNANEGHRMSHGSQTQSRRDSKAKRRSSRSSKNLSGSSFPSASSLPQYPPAAAQPPAAQGPATGLQIQASALPPISTAVEPSREEVEPPKPQWRGPPALLDVREGLMRSRLSSFSLGSDPWSARSNPGMSPVETSPRQTTYPILEEGDNLPLSQRRTMLHQQIIPMSQTPAVPTPAPALAPAPVPTNSQATMAAWREYVREDLYDKRNPLAKANNSAAATANRNPFVQAERNASSVKFGTPAAESKRRGDMSDLHRNAMRRMQAMANRNMNGK
ncbi:hypothetical protein P170DRAFT_469152 [Aspergillus steynii IBT 23096]|uniref:TM7S3/TM198-like domain-containing protein n=1 Tax=Aspergillus steynii IBT 23096 TaxID=1392250 RepID=A0A2I2GLA0_9EURO|nr:uncharacterized protein P170DRAFT_469152 [Aspergillus steynii IBT 23096]PLB53658.1 hypothetical protein P170DRAFT_469152 [Aspergillus steynii IBT 23096]